MEKAVMAEEAAAEITVVETEKDNSSAAVQEMDLETPNTDEVAAGNGGKRGREEEEEANESAANGGEAKKHKVNEEEKSVEEQRIEKEESKSGPMINESSENGGESKSPKVDEEEKTVDEQMVEKEESKSGPATNESSENGEESKKPKVDEEEKSVEDQMVEKEAAKSGPVSVGYKSFETSVEMFDYFFKFLRFWPPNINVNKYEHTMLLELLKKGHMEPDKKIGSGIRAFQVRYHPQWKSRCFFLVREDDSSDDFSFRKCVDHIIPLPENMQIKSDGNEGGGRGGRGGGRGNWRGGRGGRGGGKSRN